ncbi:MAG: TlpA family protein disulfide reductase [Gammaproteobacteria bacterium]|nr:TlpA family protein disulfide reductase [Gammaproteobacteria bacterium]
MCIVINKKNRFRFVILVVCYLPFLIVSAQSLPPLTHKLTKLKEAGAAPELILVNLDDEIVDIRNLKGKVVIVNFWATRCPPCRREMGSLEKLYMQTKDSGVEVLAVNIGEDLDTVFSFLGMVDPSPSFQMLLDLEAVSVETWGVKGLPTTYILNKQGDLVYRAVGGREFDHPDIVSVVIDLSG